MIERLSNFQTLKLSNFKLHKMNRILHISSIILYILIITGAFIVLMYLGNSFYNLPIEERFFHPQYELLKPSGFIGHGLGIVGALLIIVGLFGYMARKRMKIFSRVGLLKYWLELHIFLCTLGTVFVLFHTTFKFGGIISVGFWSMILVWVSGVVGRFLYIEIPRTIEGRELSLIEIQEIKSKLDLELNEKYGISTKEVKTSRFSQIRLKLISNHISKNDFRIVRRLIRKQKLLEGRIKRLEKIHNLFKYWHIVHLPFALIFLIILAIHVGVVLFWGYKWIF